MRGNRGQVLGPAESTAEKERVSQERALCLVQYCICKIFADVTGWLPQNSRASSCEI